MPAPTVDAPPDFPLRLEEVDNDAYAAKVQTWGQAMPTFGAQVKGVGVYVDASGEAIALDRAATAADGLAAAVAAEQAEATLGDTEDALAEAQAAAASAQGGPGTNATSATSLSIGTGSKSPVLQQTGKTLVPTQWVSIFRTSDPTTRMRGPITGVSNLAAGPNPTITVDVRLINGSGGPYTDWTITQIPEPGADFASQAEAEAGSVTDKLMSPLRTAQAIVSQARAGPDVIVQCQKTSGTDGGAFSGAWAARELNTVTRNLGSVASLASNAVTLPAGVWLLTARAVWVGSVINALTRAKVRLRNTTAGATLGVGETITFNGQDSGGAGEMESGGVSEVVCIVTLSTSSAIELQGYSNNSSLTGKAAGSGEVEVYATFEATRMAQ